MPDTINSEIAACLIKGMDPDDVKLEGHEERNILELTPKEGS